MYKLTATGIIAELRRSRYKYDHDTNMIIVRLYRGPRDCQGTSRAPERQDSACLNTLRRVAEPRHDKRAIALARTVSVVRRGEESERPRLDALARRRARGGVGVNERAVRGEARAPVLRGIEYLE